MSTGTTNRVNSAQAGRLARAAQEETAAQAQRTAPSAAGSAGLTARASRAPENQRTLTPLPGTEGVRYDPHAALDPNALVRLYGPSQLNAALSSYSYGFMREVAENVMASHPGTRPADMRSADALREYVVEQLTGAKPIRSASNLPTSSRASAPRSSRAAEATPHAGGRRGAQVEAPRLTPLPGTEGIRFDPHARLDPQTLGRIYGSHQLGAALSAYSLATLREGLSVLQERYPDLRMHGDLRSKAGLTNAIVDAYQQIEGR